jgi:RNA 2',3'-cyclic 3'-phosphodiesterase
MSDTIRTFIAISLPEHIIEEIGKMQKKVRKSGFKMRWVKPENIHITLKFLGDIHSQMIQPIVNCMDRCGKEHHFVQLFSKGIGVFPGLKRPRILWAGIDGETDALRAIQEQLDEYLRVTGLPKENRPFKGHLTIGRFKGRADSKKLLSVIKEFSVFETKSFSAETLSLYKSDLTPSGAIYTRIAAAPLQKQV